MTTTPILLLGAVGGLLAIYKGWTGISDPIPGFTEARREAEDSLIEAAQETCERYLDAAEATYETAKERLEDQVEALEEAQEERNEALAQLNDAIVAHNHAIASAIEQLQQLYDVDRASREYVKRKKQRGQKVDTANFEALRIPRIATPEAATVSADSVDPAELMQRLDAAFDLTSAAIHEAHTVFQADVTAFDLSDNPGG